MVVPGLVKLELAYPQVVGKLGKVLILSRLVRVALTKNTCRLVLVTPELRCKLSLIVAFRIT